MTPEKKIEAVRVRMRRQLIDARARAECFVEYAFRHEADGSKLTNAPFHDEWHAFLRSQQRAILVAPVEHAKTQHVGIGYTLHRIGKNPNLRCAIVSNTGPMAEKLLRAVRTHIESNQRVREVFPDLRPSLRSGDAWGSTAITVERETIAKDPTLQACGAHGAIVGSRLDLIVMDDILDFENTATEAQRKKLIEWVETTLFTRLTEDGQVVIVGTPWHPEDLLAVLSQRQGFAVRRLCAVQNPDDPAESWRPSWPEVWPLARLLAQRATMQEHVFMRKYLTRVRHDASARFKEDWILRALAAGKGRTLLNTAPKAQGGVRLLPCFTGVDLGVGEGEDDALSVLFTIAVDDRGRCIPVDIQAGHWTAPEIIDRIARVWLTFGSTVAVESNGAQKFLVQMANQRFPVHALNTGSNKWGEFGVESLAVELRNGYWVIPSGPSGTETADETRAWISEMLHYSPSAHTGDRLMASWLAREAARKLGGQFVQRADMQAR